jgi:hypothetical protein
MNSEDVDVDGMMMIIMTIIIVIIVITIRNRRYDDIKERDTQRECSN